jgi:hypothetical protein
MKTQLTLVSMAFLLLAGCAEPTPPCLVFRSSGGVYTAEFLNGTVTTSPVTANCALFSTSTFQGVPADLATTGSIYPYGFIGGFPFRASQVGVDKFAPDPALAGSHSKVSIAPEIFYAGTGQAGYVIGDLTDENPDAQNVCHVADLGTVTGDFDWGGTAGTKTVTMAWTNMAIYETGLIQGTEFTAEVTATIADNAAGANACTATYNVLAVAPSTTCVIVDNDGNIANGGQAPFGADQVQGNLCTSASVPSGDQVWINYGNNGFLTGNAVNPSIPIVCDAVSGYCVLPPPAAGAAPTLPVIIDPPRP